MLKALARIQTRTATRDRGATAVEYGLLVALMAAVIVAVVSVGEKINNTFATVNTAI